MSIPLTNSMGILNSTQTLQNQPLVLNSGQMIHGQIKQLFPGQMAEIQVGSHNIIAKLEVPMKAGDSYYFQVHSVKPEVQLKIISGPTGATEGQTRQLNNLMEAMQLPKSSEMKLLLSFIVNNKIPMSRESLLQAEALLKNVPIHERNEALVALQRLAQLKLPFTESLFRSLLGIETKESIHTTLGILRDSLLSDSSVSSASKSLIISLLDGISKPFAGAKGNVLLGQSLTTLLDPTQGSETRFAIVQLLRNANLLPNSTSLANLQQVIAALVTEGVQGNQTTTTRTGEPSNLLAQLKALITADTGHSSQNKDTLTAILNRSSSTQQSAEVTMRSIQEFSHAITRMLAENMIAEPFKSDGASKQQLLTLLGQQSQPDVVNKLMALVRNAGNSDNVAIQRLVQTSEGLVANAVEGNAIKEAIQTIVRSLGLNYEVALLGKEPNIGRIMESLKPQLIALMQDLAISPMVRESAEQVVMRLNGPQLMSGENGVQHQLVMQVPLDFFGKRIDATLQWNGRMKDNGKIDPDFARILFYLDLNSLKKTIIDMQVQNRIVSVTVFNADPVLKTVGAPMQGLLKEGLDSAGYKLSGVFFKGFSADKEIPNESKSQVVIDGQGVDFRI